MRKKERNMLFVDEDGKNGDGVDFARKMEVLISAWTASSQASSRARRVTER
jgi:hypothetical protein